VNETGPNPQERDGRPPPVPNLGDPRLISARRG